MMSEYKRYDEYKDSGIKIIGDIPREWNLNKIKYNNIINPNKSELSYKKIDVSFIPMEYIKDGFIENKDIKNIDEVYNGYTYFKEGDILLAKVTPCFENGNLGIAKDLKNGIGFGTTEVHVIRAKKDNKKFIYYLFQNKHFKEKGNSEMYGAGGLKRIPSDFVENYIYPRPDYQTQICISNYLDQKTAKIDEIINKKEKLIDNLKKYKKSVITEAVTKGKLGDKYINEDGELVDELEMKDSGVEWIGETPKYYNLLQLRRVINKFVDYRGKTPDKTDKGIPLITAKNINNGKVSHESSPEFIAKKDYDSWMTRGMPEQGDVLITTEAPLGKTAQIKNEKIALAQRIILFKVDFNYITNDYLKYHFLSSFGQDELWIKATGSTALGIKASKLRGTRIFVPSLYSQDKITNYLDKKTHQINMIIQKTKQSIEKYKEYKKSLIFEAVTGKIDLRDYELEGGEDFAEHNNSSETERECISAVD